MPRICHFLGITISMYYRGEHNPPHFHATYSGKEAEFQIRPLQIIAGDLPPRIRRLVFEWASQHEEELMENWQRAQTRQTLNLLPPLE